MPIEIALVCLLETSETGRPSLVVRVMQRVDGQTRPRAVLTTRLEDLSRDTDTEAFPVQTHGKRLRDLAVRWRVSEHAPSLLVTKGLAYERVASADICTASAMYVTLRLASYSMSHRDPPIAFLKKFIAFTGASWLCFRSSALETVAADWAWYEPDDAGITRFEVMVHHLVAMQTPHATH